jgi:hypothetical protein
MKLLILTFAATAWAQPVDVDQIMARVAENQSKALEYRKDWIYNQKQRLRLLRGNGKIAREERREYVVTPDVQGSRKELTRFDGKYETKGQYISYDKPGHTYKEMDIDGELIDEMSNEMINDNSRDGIGKNLFPLTAREQVKYSFTLIRSEIYRGRPVYRIAFEPKQRQKFDDSSMWKGEALIDVEESQPVMISTKMAPKIPMAVKILLGTNIKGLGFSLAYQKFSDGVWFPVSYGGEFEVRAVFFYKRNISISMVNDDFRRTDVSSKVAYAIEEK